LGEAKIMSKKERMGQVEKMGEREPYKVRLPGFITNQEIGLGDVIKRVTFAVGINPCGGCERRANALNRWLVFSSRRAK
jgi:hypothetical protein